MGDDIQAESAPFGCRGLADTTAADHAQGLIAEPVDDPARLSVPDALARRAEVAGQTAGLGERQGDGVGRYLVYRIVGYIGDPDAAGAGGGDVDGVQSRADAADQAATLHALDQIRGDRLDRHHQGVGLAGGLSGLLAIQVAHMLDLQISGAEDLFFDLDIPEAGVSDNDGRVHRLFSLLIMETEAPSRANSSAPALPRPKVAPVMMATFPANLVPMRFSFCSVAAPKSYPTVKG